MNHQEALKEMSVERYLLGELSGEALNSFEEHLFECSECATDVKMGASFIDNARTEFGSPRRSAAPLITRGPRWTSWFASPWVLGPALAACLLILAFQTFAIRPRIQREIAEAQTPSVLNPLVLANAGARGDSVPAIVAKEHQSFAISIDIPSADRFSSYLCSLHAPDGSLLWQTTVSREQVRDALLINIPTSKTKEGLNTVLIQGLPASGSSSGTLEDLATYRFQLTIQK